MLAIFRTFILDGGSLEYVDFWKSRRRLSFFLNLSALTNMSASGKTRYPLLRMIDVYFFNMSRPASGDANGV
jgi:hypothetical protein